MNFDLAKHADFLGETTRMPQTCRAELKLFRREYSGLQKEMDCKL